MKSVYIVTGSEDGIILVSSSAQRAAQRARDYVGFPPNDYQENLMVRRIRADGGYTVNAPSCEASVERWYVNS